MLLLQEPKWIQTYPCYRNRIVKDPDVVAEDCMTLQKIVPIYSCWLSTVTVQSLSLLTESFDVAAFTVYSVLMNVNDLFALIHSHLFQIDVI